LSVRLIQIEVGFDKKNLKFEQKKTVGKICYEEIKMKLLLVLVIGIVLVNAIYCADGDSDKGSFFF
jgi:hypothetical protein